MVVSKEMSAARKLGTQNRSQTPRVSGTRKKASNASVCLATALLGEKQATECGNARQHAGHRGYDAQLDQQRDPNQVVRHTINVSRRAGAESEE